MADGGQTVPRIAKAEHIGPNDTGDNIEAKRVAPYIWDPNAEEWIRNTGSGLADARDTNNEQTGTLAAGATFNGTFTKVSNYAQFQVLYASTVPLTSVQIIWSNDGVNDLGGNLGASTVTIRELNGYYVAYHVGDNNNIAPYYRLKVVNGSSDQTAFPGVISIAWLANNPYNGAFSFLDDQLTNFSRGLLVRSVPAGVQPDGDFVNQPADGLAFETDTELGAAGVYLSDWIDSDGYTAIELFVKSDVVSASDGIEIEYTDNAEATGTFTADASTDVITTTDTTHGLENGQVLRLTTTGTLPGGLATDTDYYIVSATTSTFKLSATRGGSAIDITDAGTGTHSLAPIVRATIRRNFSTTDVTRGFATYAIASELDGFRVRYTNGGTIQGTFYLSANLRTNITENPKMPLESDISSTQNTVMNRAALFAKNAAGVYANIERGTGGGLDVGIVQHEVETPIKSLPTIKVTRRSVAGTAVEVTSSAPLSGRRSISLKAICSGSAVIYVGHSNAVTSSTGYPLAHDQSIDMEVDDTTLIWAIASSGTQALSVFEIGT